MQYPQNAASTQRIAQSKLNYTTYYWKPLLKKNCIFINWHLCICMFTVTLYLVFRILPLLLGSSRNLCLYQTWTRQIIVVDPRIRGLGVPLGKLVDLSKGLWLEVRRWRCGVWGGVDVLIKQPAEGKETILLLITIGPLQIYFYFQSTRWCYMITVFTTVWEFLSIFAIDRIRIYLNGMFKHACISIISQCFNYWKFCIYFSIYKGNKKQAGWTPEHQILFPPSCECGGHICHF